MKTAPDNAQPYILFVIAQTEDASLVPKLQALAKPNDRTPPDEWPEFYPERLKTRLSLTAPLNLEQIEEPEAPLPEEPDSR